MVLFIVRSTCHNYIAAADSRQLADAIGRGWITSRLANGYTVTQVILHQTYTEN